MKTSGLIEALRRATVRRLGGYVRASQLDSGFERFVTGPGLGDDSGITGAILLGKRAATGA